MLFATIEKNPSPQITAEDPFIAKWTTAARQDNVQEARRLLDTRDAFDIDTPLTSLGNSALGIALYHGNLAFAQFALEQGASPRFRNGDKGCKNSILQLASRHLDGLAMVLGTEAKLDVNHQDARLCTPLMEAVNIIDDSVFQRPEHKWAPERANCIDLLVEYGAQVDLQNIEGRTALMSAAFVQSEVLIRALMRHGARINIRSGCDKRAEDYATDPHIKALLSKPLLQIV
jgi:ankyrin repeat protein